MTFRAVSGPAWPTPGEGRRQCFPCPDGLCERDSKPAQRKPDSLRAVKGLVWSVQQESRLLAIVETRDAYLASNSRALHEDLCRQRSLRDPKQNSTTKKDGGCLERAFAPCLRRSWSRTGSRECDGQVPWSTETKTLTPPSTSRAKTMD
eukprot:2515634-Rhodomonas_salina.1